MNEANSMIVYEPMTEFDDEEEERLRSEVDKARREFLDEPFVDHDKMPESDSDEDDDVGRKKKQQERRESWSRGSGNLYFGQTFFNGVAFKEQVIDYALAHCYNLYQYRFDRNDKLGYKCYGGDPEEPPCHFQVYASILPKDKIWRIRKFQPKHSCTPNGTCSVMKVPVIARLFVDRIRDEPDYFMPMKIEYMIFKKYGITCTRDQVQAARCNALKWIDNEYDQQFKRLRDYVAELEASNEGTSVELHTVKNDEGLDVFERFYVCFAVLKKTWKKTMRPIIGVDDTFLKHKISGQLLVALGRDSNNVIYPIAWGVVQVENKDNWVWFVEKLKEDLDLKDGSGFIMVSDRQKGLIRAVEIVLPEMEHRMCVRHIYGNLKKKHGGNKTMKPFIYNLSWSYNMAEYNINLEKHREYDMDVYADVMKTNPKTWCRAFQKLGNYCEDVTNNPVESFNNTVKKPRAMPFVPMLEMIATQAMARISTRSALSHEHQGVCTPYVDKFFKKGMKNAKLCKVSRGTNGWYQSRLFGCNFRVNLEKWSCSCNKWDVCGIPCSHAYAVILHKKLYPENYVVSWFRTALWRRNYTDGLIPVTGAAFWPPTGAPNVHPPPGENKKMTKAEKKRRKEANESPSKRRAPQSTDEPGAKRSVKCSVCGTIDHNKRFHKNDKVPQANGEGSSQHTAPGSFWRQPSGTSQVPGPSEAPGSFWRQATGTSQASQAPGPSQECVTQSTQ